MLMLADLKICIYIYTQGGRNEICLGEAPKFFQGVHTETIHEFEFFFDIWT